MHHQKWLDQNSQGSHGDSIPVSLTYQTKPLPQLRTDLKYKETFKIQNSSINIILDFIEFSSVWNIFDHEQHFQGFGNCFSWLCTLQRSIVIIIIVRHFRLFLTILSGFILLTIFPLKNHSFSNKAKRLLPIARLGF